MVDAARIQNKSADLVADKFFTSLGLDKNGADYAAFKEALVNAIAANGSDPTALNDQAGNKAIMSHIFGSIAHFTAQDPSLGAKLSENFYDEVLAADDGVASWFAEANADGAISDAEWSALDGITTGAATPANGAPNSDSGSLPQGTPAAGGNDLPQGDSAQANTLDGAKANLKTVTDAAAGSEALKAAITTEQNGEIFLDATKLAALGADETKLNEALKDLPEDQKGKVAEAVKASTANFDNLKVLKDLSGDDNFINPTEVGGTAFSKTTSDNPNDSEATKSAKQNFKTIGEFAAKNPALADAVTTKQDGNTYLDFNKIRDLTDQGKLDAATTGLSAEDKTKVADAVKWLSTDGDNLGAALTIAGGDQLLDTAEVGGISLGKAAGAKEGGVFTQGDGKDATETQKYASSLLNELDDKGFMSVVSTDGSLDLNKLAEIAKADPATDGAVWGPLTNDKDQTTGRSDREHLKAIANILTGGGKDGVEKAAGELVQGYAALGGDKFLTSDEIKTAIENPAAIRSQTGGQNGGEFALGDTSKATEAQKGLADLFNQIDDSNFTSLVGKDGGLDTVMLNQITKADINSDSPVWGHLSKDATTEGGRNARQHLQDIANILVHGGSTPEQKAVAGAFTEYVNASGSMSDISKDEFKKAIENPSDIKVRGGKGEYTLGNVEGATPGQKVLAETLNMLDDYSLLKYVTTDGNLDIKKLEEIALANTNGVNPVWGDLSKEPDASGKSDRMRLFEAAGVLTGKGKAPGEKEAEQLLRQSAGEDGLLAKDELKKAIETPNSTGGASTAEQQSTADILKQLNQDKFLDRVGGGNGGIDFDKLEKYATANPDYDDKMWGDLSKADRQQLKDIAVIVTGKTTNSKEKHISEQLKNFAEDGHISQDELEKAILNPSSIIDLKGKKAEESSAENKKVVDDFMKNEKKFDSKDKINEFIKDDAEVKDVTLIVYDSSTGKFTKEKMPSERSWKSDQVTDKSALTFSGKQVVAAELTVNGETFTIKDTVIDVSKPISGQPVDTNFTYLIARASEK